jgi:outer membrane biosynthesis protein TonB
MSAIPMTFGMNWGVANDDDLRFKRIARNNLLVAIALGILIPLLPLPEIEPPVVEQPERLARLIFEQEIIQPPPPPKQVIKQPEPLPQKVEEPKPLPQKVEKAPPKPVVPKISAREKAQQSGILAMSDALSDLRDNTVASNFRNTNLSQAGGNAAKTERAILTSGTTSSSGGIQTSSLSRNTGGGALAGRSTTAVHSPTGNAAGGSVGGKGKGDKAAGRSIEEIQMVFDRNKGSIYSVYNRALRNDPTLQGKVVLKLTIAPSGKVLHCSVVSSELHDAELAGKVSSRVKMFDFGAKDVTEVTITYPIDFLPA